jgi:hypothetical protein
MILELALQEIYSKELNMFKTTNGYGLSVISGHYSLLEPCMPNNPRNLAERKEIRARSTTAG